MTKNEYEKICQIIDAAIEDCRITESIVIKDIPMENVANLKEQLKELINK